MDILTEIAQARYDIFEKQDSEEPSFDITFKFSDQQILKSHKFMLTSLSETFKAMLSENWNKTGIIDIKLNSFEEFKQLLKFCYLGYSAITNENVDILLELSHCFNIPLLTKVCINFIDKNDIINYENVVAYFTIAEGYDFGELLQIIEMFLKNVSVKFLNSDTFLESTKEFVIFLLALDKIAVEESDLFKAVINWGKKKLNNEIDKSSNMNELLKNELKDILPLIRFPVMNLDFLLDDVVKHGYLFSYEDLSNILQDARELSQAKRLDTPRSAYSSTSRIEKYIEITDINFKTISAPFLYFDNRLINDIDKAAAFGPSVRLSNGSYWKMVKFEKPKIIQIRDPAYSYFLVIDRDFDLSIKESNIESGDHVIAQFKNTPGFSCGEGCRIKCVRK